MTTADRRIASAGLFLGMGMGGFVDGIVFHQLLQLHAMLSAVHPKVDVASVELNMFWDGVFHALTWVLTAIGIVKLWHAGTARGLWSGHVLAGGALLGWGVFNLVEGIVDHYLLGIHHVVERLGASGYDLLFVASGLVLVVAGARLMRRSEAAGTGPVQGAGPGD
jgi:uncharacterized membrane protein